MKILILSLCVIGFAIANETINQNNNSTAPIINNIGNVDNNASAQNIQIINVSDSNSTVQNNNNVVDISDGNTNAPQANKTTDKDAQNTINPDEKLKNDIITFDRIDYIKNNANIDDPFIYVYPQTETELANILKTEQAVLILNGILENRASINNIWVSKDDIVEGWTVSNIEQDRVELKFKSRTKILYVYSNNSNIKIK